ncbi:hypothetical protein J6S88_01615 [bacterium]|nr:hypothetical protein [bacterium]
MSLNDKKSRMLIMPYGMYCNYDLFLDVGYSHFPEEPKFIFFIGPSYNYCTSELLTFNPQEFAKIEDYAHFDRAFLEKFRLKRNLQFEDMEFEREELLFPHIKYLRKHRKDFKCFPLFFHNVERGVIKSIIEEYWGECLFVILTTMSIGMCYNDARRADEFHAEEIEYNEARHLTFMDLSAYKILPDLFEFNKANNFAFRRIALQNSGDVSNNMASTTGYGAWYLDEHVK